MDLFKKYFWRFIISLIGISMLMMPVFYLSLGLFGTTHIGTMTSYRRILGERGEVIPNRYTYSLGYQFYVNDVKYEGSSTVINSPLFIKPDGNSLIEVRYIESAPYLNALASDTKFDIGKFAISGMGIFLIKIMNPHEKRKKPRNQ